MVDMFGARATTDPGEPSDSANPFAPRGGAGSDPFAVVADRPDDTLSGGVRSPWFQTTSPGGGTQQTVQAPHTVDLSALERTESGRTESGHGVWQDIPYPAPPTSPISLIDPPPQVAPAPEVFQPPAAPQPPAPSEPEAGGDPRGRLVTMDLAAQRGRRAPAPEQASVRLLGGGSDDGVASPAAGSFSAGWVASDQPAERRNVGRLALVAACAAAAIGVAGAVVVTSLNDPGVFRVELGTNGSDQTGEQVTPTDGSTVDGAASPGASLSPSGAAAAVGAAAATRTVDLAPARTPGTRTTPRVISPVTTPKATKAPTPSKSVAPSPKASTAPSATPTVTKQPTPTPPSTPPTPKPPTPKPPAPAPAEPPPVVPSPPKSDPTVPPVSPSG